MQADKPQPEAGPSSRPISSSASTSAAKTETQSDRLFIGNLSPTVDEYTLLQIFSKYGKITKLDFMFHKTGVLKGKPRGYAFIEFSNKEDAGKALTKLHDRLLRGRKLVVTSANSAPISESHYPTKGRRHTDQPKTTTLSLLKKKRHGQNTTSQIAAMEAKLAAMARSKPTDEDYVPGSSAYPLSGSASASASPAPAQGDEGMYYSDEEEGMTKEEAEQAANALEQEFTAAVKEEPGASRTPLSTLASPNPSRSNDLAPPLPTLDHGALPVRPSTPLTEAERRKDARDKEFKKGLAGLPAKPAF